MTTAATAPAPAGINCPKCGGPIWDNRLGKRNPKAPDFKCRDKSCDGVIWPPKNGTAPLAQPPTVVAPPAAVNAATKMGFSAGPHVPGIDGPTPPAATTVVSENGIARLNASFSLYDVCQDHVLAVAVPKLVKAGIGASDTSIAAMTATLYIQASQKGLAS